jgi:serine/threonine protein kinase
VLATALADDDFSGWLRRLRDRGEGGVAAVPLLRCLRGAAQALDSLHSWGQFPNNVKPSNLLRLCGRARLALPARHPSQGEAVTLFGTPLYMAPEIWTARPRPQSDQYALAMVYHEMRTGRLPFGGRGGLPGVVEQHLTGTPDLSALPVAEQAPLRRAMARDPGERFPTCAALLRALWRAAVQEGRTSCGGDDPALTAVADPSWLRFSDGLIVRLAQTIDQGGRFEELPVLADALEDAGCTDEAILGHCRSASTHVRGCWVVDLLSGREWGRGRV